MRLSLNLARLRGAAMIAVVAVAASMLAGCTQETQNRFGRALQNWTGTRGVLEVYSGGKLVKRFINIDKLSTASGTNDGNVRPYRFGYGHLDSDLDFTVGPGEEKKVYFEVSDYSTEYIFFESPY